MLATFVTKHNSLDGGTHKQMDLMHALTSNTTMSHSTQAGSTKTAPD